MVKEEDVPYQKDAEQSLKALRKATLKGFGKKCDTMVLMCGCCMAWFALESLEDLWGLKNHAWKAWGAKRKWAPRKLSAKEMKMTKKKG